VEKVLQDLFAHGWAAPLWFLMLFSNVLLPWATLWSRRIRRSIPALLFICIFVQVGMYLERYLIVPTSLGRNELPFSWGIYVPHLPETLITIGAFALVGFLYVLFSRIFPLIPVWEVYEGQVLHTLVRIGRALVPTRAEPE
jgi:Ni/Fe-hydrogenase subunit HybB-like protein